MSLPLFDTHEQNVLELKGIAPTEHTLTTSGVYLSESVRCYDDTYNRNKANKFGYDPEQNNMMVELCARIGLDFDLDPKWKYITEFIAIKERYIGLVSKYIDFTIFEKDYSRTGSSITDWSLREALSYLRYPKRPVPKLHDLEKEAEANGM